MRPSLNFLVICICLSIIIVIIPVRKPDAHIGDSLTEGLVVNPAPVMDPVSKYSDIVRRKLFSEQEKNVTPVTELSNIEDAKAETRDINFSVVGILYGGDNDHVLVRENPDGAVISWRQGEEFQGWSLDNITASYVDISSENEFMQLHVSMPLEEINGLQKLDATLGEVK